MEIQENNGEGPDGVMYASGLEETYYSLDTSAIPVIDRNNERPITSDDETFFSLDPYSSIRSPSVIPPVELSEDTFFSLDSSWDQGNGLPVDLHKAIGKFQALFDKVKDIRDTNRKILKNLNEEERTQRSMTEQTQTARKEMEDYLKILEERTTARELKLRQLRAALTTITQNVDKIEVSIKERQRHKANKEKELKIQERKSQQLEVQIHDKPSVERQTVQDATVNDESKVKDIMKRNEQGLKCRKTLNEDDNRNKIRHKRRRKPKENKASGNHNGEILEKKEMAPVRTSAAAANDSEQNQSQRRPLRTTQTQNLQVSRGKEFKSGSGNQEELRMIPEEKWADWANEAMVEGKRDLRPTGKGPDTILLLDTSASMAGEPLQELKYITKQFLRDIERNSDKGIPENVALVTFGHETRVVRNTCNDYRGLVQDIDALRAGGPSPMGGGLLMAIAAAANANKPSVSGVTVHPRIILISDGIATADSLLSGPDVQLPTHPRDEVHLRLLRCAADVYRRHLKVFCVPVGNAEMMHIEGISATTNGKIFKKEEMNRLSNMYRNMVLAFNFKTKIPLEDQRMFRTMVQLLSFTDNLSQEDLDDVTSYALDPDYNTDEENLYKEIDRKLPPIGTRVRRGPDWHYADQDNYGPGTVIGQENGGMVWVHWDNARPNRYHCGVGGANDVAVVDEPRILRDDQLIEVGCNVRRGKDWRYGNDDGGVGSIGVVFVVNTDATVAVRWPNRNMKRYKYGRSGYFEVEICDPQQRMSESSKVDRVQGEAEGYISDYIIVKPKTFISEEEMNRRNVSLNEKYQTNPSVMLQQDEDSSASCDSDFEIAIESERGAINCGTSEPVTGETQKDLSIVDKQTGLETNLDNNHICEDENRLDGFKWEYKDFGKDWRPYPADVMMKIEQSFRKLPNGTTVIHMDDKICRIVFSKLIQVNTSTKEVADIRRLGPCF